MSGASEPAWMDARCIDSGEFGRTASFDTSVIKLDEDRVRYASFEWSALSHLSEQEVESVVVVEFDPSRTNWLPAFPLSVRDIIDFKRGPNGFMFDVDVVELGHVLADASDGGHDWLAFQAPTQRELAKVAAGIDAGPADGHQQAAARARHAQTDEEKRRAIELYKSGNFRSKDEAAEALTKLVALEERTIRDALKGVAKPR